MSINVNIDKAKNIAHNLRRKKRDNLFAPYDNIIMKQIPGNDYNVAEQARADIRAADSIVQENINSATTPEEIKQILVDYEAV